LKDTDKSLLSKRTRPEDFSLEFESDSKRVKNEEDPSSAENSFDDSDVKKALKESHLANLTEEQQIALAIQKSNMEFSDEPSDSPQAVCMLPLLAGKCWKDESNSSAVYRLQAIVNHMGSVKFGHYICFTRNKNSWLMCNDSRVSQVEDDVTNAPQEGYLYFYIHENLKNYTM
jgi:hypothetical protein